MRPADFAKARARIILRAQGRAAFYERAMAHLVKKAGAQEVRVGGQVVAWVMGGGGTVCVKRRYRDQEAANDELAHIKAHTRGYKAPARSYRCPHCGGWHLTSQALKNPA